MFAGVGQTTGGGGSNPPNPPAIQTLPIGPFMGATLARIHAPGVPAGLLVIRSELIVGNMLFRIELLICGIVYHRI
jgi:hypothetical protein